MTPLPSDLYENIEVLNLDTRTERSLLRHRIEYVGQLVQFTRRELSKLRGVGKKNIDDIGQALEKHGLRFGVPMPAGSRPEVRKPVVSFR